MAVKPAASISAIRSALIASSVIAAVSRPRLAPQPAPSSASTRRSSPAWALSAAMVSSHTQPAWPPPCRNTKSVTIRLPGVVLVDISGNSRVTKQALDTISLVKTFVRQELHPGGELQFEPVGDLLL